MNEYCKYCECTECKCDQQKLSQIVDALRLKTGKTWYATNDGKMYHVFRLYAMNRLGLHFSNEQLKQGGIIDDIITAANNQQRNMVANRKPKSKDAFQPQAVEKRKDITISLSQSLLKEVEILAVGASCTTAEFCSQAIAYAIKHMA